MDVRALRMGVGSRSPRAAVVLYTSRVTSARAPASKLMYYRLVLNGEGKLNIDLTFDSMDDFSPDAVARNVEPLSKLLEARTQLANLLTYMDGKNGAEELIGKVLQDPTLLQALTHLPKQDEATEGKEPQA